MYQLGSNRINDTHFILPLLYFSVKIIGSLTKSVDKRLSSMQEEKFYEELLGLSLLRINWVEKQAGKLIIHCEYQSEECRCPQCGLVTAVINQYNKRQVRDLDISGKQVWLDIRVPQFICHTCRRYFTESPTWANPGRSYTKRQAKWVFEMCSKQPFTEATVAFRFVV